MSLVLRRSLCLSVVLMLVACFTAAANPVQVEKGEKPKDAKMKKDEADAKNGKGAMKEDMAGMQPM